MHIFNHPNYNFLRWRWHAIALSWIIIIAGGITLATKGIPRGVEFAGGTVVIETLFGINGIGQLIVGAVRSNDVPMLQGCIMLLAVLTIAVNFVVDVGYGLLNPKVRSA